MRRRDFIKGIVGSAVPWSFAARAQQPKLPRIGILIPANPEPFWNEFQQGLREHDYIEGQTIRFEFRSAEGKPNLLRGLADELVRLKVDIIVASQTPAYWGPYSVSKAALEAMARTYAAETVTTRVRVNLFAPGAVRTRMRAQAMPGEDPLSLETPDKVAEKIVELCLPGMEQSGKVYVYPRRAFLELKPPG